MSKELTNHHELATYFEPKNLSQLPIVGQHLHFFCRYQPTHLPKTGKDKLLAKLPKIGGDDTRPLNINLGVGIYDKAGALIETAWYGKVRPLGDVIRYRGDSLQTSLDPVRQSHQEFVSIHIGSLPDNVHRLTLLVHSYYHHPLSATVGEIALTDSEGNAIHSLDFGSVSQETTALVAWELVKNGDDWRLSAPMRELDGILACGDNVNELAKKVVNGFGDDD